MNIQQHVSLKPYTTFGIATQARFFVEIHTYEDAKEVLAYCKKENLPFLILGGGSNVLFTQKYEGMVIKNNLKGITIVKEEENWVWIKANAGEVWNELVRYCVERNFGGIENLALIYGSVGAAPVQNIGAYGVEIKDVIEEVECMDIRTGEKCIFSREECKFSYRNSIFKQEEKGNYWILSITLRLTRNEHHFTTSYGAIQDVLVAMQKNISIQNVCNAVIHIRESKLPKPENIGNCGSFFKNPEIPTSKFEHLKKQFPQLVGYPTTNQEITKVAAGWLIEQCGWKGKRIGNVGSYPMQSLVIVNYGDAQGKEIWDFAQKIQQSVWQTFEIWLEPEVNII